MKVWEMMERDKVWNSYRTDGEGVTCLMCNQTADEMTLNAKGSFNNTFPHKTNCFLIQDINNCKADSFKQSWILFWLAIKSCWSMVVEVWRDFIKEMKG